MVSKSILVIEDNVSNMKLIRTLLEIGQYKVLEAEDAETGIEMSRKYRPKMILMDITLPGMDGLTATQILKREPETKDIPVIAVTANATDEIRDRAFHVGCEDFIPKPLSLQALLKSIERHLPQEGVKS